MPTKSTLRQPGAELNMDTISRVNAVGQLLVRAAATLDQVPDVELAKLEAIAGGPLQQGLRTLLQAAIKVDPTLAAAAATVKP